MNSPDRLSQGQSLAEIVANFQFPERNHQRRDGMMATVFLTHKDRLLSDAEKLNFFRVAEGHDAYPAFLNMQSAMGKCIQVVKQTIESLEVDCNRMKKQESSRIVLPESILNEVRTILTFPSARVVDGDTSVSALVQELIGDLDRYVDTNWAEGGTVVSEILDCRALAPVVQVLIREILPAYRVTLTRALSALKDVMPDLLPAYLELCYAQREQASRFTYRCIDMKVTVQNWFSEFPITDDPASFIKESTSLEKLQMVKDAISHGKMPPNRQLEWGPMPAVIDHIFQTAERERAEFVAMTDAYDVARFDARVGFSPVSPVAKQQVLHRRCLFKVIIQWFKGKQ